MIFQAGDVHESASLFSDLKEKKINMKDSGIRTHNPGGPIYYADHWTTENFSWMEV